MIHATTFRNNLNFIPKFTLCVIRPNLGVQVELNGNTIFRYACVLEQMHLLKRIDAWTQNKLNLA